MIRTETDVSCSGSDRRGTDGHLQAFKLSTMVSRELSTVCPFRLGLEMILVPIPLESPRDSCPLRADSLEAFLLPSHVQPHAQLWGMKRIDGEGCWHQGSGKGQGTLASCAGSRLDSKK